MNLVFSKTVRFSAKEKLYFDKLKEIRINPNQFIRLAFREKINKDYKEIERKIKEEKVKLPF